MKETEQKNQIAVTVKNLSKEFKIPHERINTVSGAFVNLFKKKTYETFYALKDVSFEVKKGEFFGIIGRNGSGKSTLLKILAGVYSADKGAVKIHGLISPFLELGIGFNPELSGRDNIYLNATVLGLTEKEIDEKFDSIVAFSELERFIDQKLKNYSSGMSVRLAFSVAIHANREILLMDEVLAVGDANFQAKCLAEFMKYKEQGKTVILVTHDINTVEKYCDRAMLLREGKVEMVGVASEVTKKYSIQNDEDINRAAQTKDIIEHISRQFLSCVGYKLDVNEPKTFNEKLQWLKLYYHDPLMTECSDKFEVRNYIKKTIGEKYLIKLIGVYNNVDEIDFKNLPDSFVLKVNHGSGQNIICRDKSRLDFEDIKRKLSGWLKPEFNHYHFSYEWCYKDIRPRIVCEEYIDTKGGDLPDYKFMCFNGEPKMLFVCSDRQKGLKVDFFDLDWNRLPFIRKYENSQKDIKRPKNFSSMLKLAKKLAKPFPFVRVDFYEVNDCVYFGEMTFYPGAGLEPFTPEEWDYKLGEMLELPKKDER